jgi:hypothetical protein
MDISKERVRSDAENRLEMRRVWTNLWGNSWNEVVICGCTENFDSNLAVEVRKVSEKNDDEGAYQFRLLPIKNDALIHG